MSLIDNIVDIKIDKNRLGIVSGGFNNLLIIGKSKKVHRVKTYSSIDEVVSDYESTTPEYKAASLAFGQSTKLSRVLIGQAMDSESYVDAYGKIEQETNDFYGVMIFEDSSNPFADVVEFSALIESKNKIFGVSSNEPKILDASDTTSILSQLKALNRERTFVIYNSGANDTSIFPEAAWFGLMLSKDAGSATWAYKSLSGFKTDKLSTNQMKIIDDKHGNYYVPLASRNVMLTGRTTSGEYIDIIQGLDWLTAQIRTQIANVFVLSDKVPYTNAGIAVIESMVRNSLNAAVDRDIIDEDSIRVTVPDVRKIPSSDKQNRLLPDVKFEGRLSGAVHKVKIQGTVEL